MTTTGKTKKTRNPQTRGSIKFVTEADCFVNTKRFRGFTTLKAAKRYINGLTGRRDFSRAWIYSITKNGHFREQAFIER